MTIPIGRRIRQCGGLFLMCAALALNVPAAAVQKQSVGWIERVKIYPGGLTVRAKLDSGANTASLDCACQEPFERNGEDWVRFKVTNFRGETVTLERKVVRTVTIKRHFGETQERLVVMLGICLGNVYKETEVNLVDRAGFKYQMLIGRKYLKGRFVIDPSRITTAKPECKDVPDGQ